MLHASLLEDKRDEGLERHSRATDVSLESVASSSDAFQHLLHTRGTQRRGEMGDLQKVSVRHTVQRSVFEYGELEMLFS